MCSISAAESWERLEEMADWVLESSAPRASRGGRRGRRARSIGVAFVPAWMARRVGFAVRTLWTMLLRRE
jgi:hypothetical protein